MKRYTVQVSFAAYNCKTVSVEAESLESALQLAIEDDSDDWKSSDHAGDTFVDAACEGAGDPFGHATLAIPELGTLKGDR